MPMIQDEEHQTPMLDETRIEDNVDLIKIDGREIYLVGTAHISQKSVELSQKVIHDVKPDAVAVELCASRFQSLKDPDRWKNTDLVSVIRQGKAYVLLAQLMLAGFQKKLGDQLSIKPGAEMMSALKAADEVGAAHVLADRDIKTTLKRTWRGLGLWGSLKVTFSMLVSAFGKKNIDIKEIERLKTSDALEELMGEFTRKLPEVKTALIDERDQYLAAKIRASSGRKIVAVVGAGHIPGIKQWLTKPIDLKALEEIPPKSMFWKGVSWALPASLIFLVAYGFFTSGSTTSVEMMQAWFWILGLSSAIGASLAMAHPITILTVFCVTPFTSLHPMIAAGWVAGLVEALLRKPRVGDFETVADDVTTLPGFFRNRVSRILLVIALTNFLGGIGKIVGISTVASFL